MTPQTTDNKDRLATIKSAQNALVYDLIMPVSYTHLTLPTSSQV